MGVYLVTGGAGFIGSHLVEALIRRGDEVRVLDNLSTGSLDNLAPVKGRVRLVVGDIEDPAAVRTAMRGVEVVFHEAALASVPRSLADPVATHQACATGTLNLLVAAREAGVRRVVYAASSSAYGNSERLPKHESDPPRPLSPYAVAKLAGEQYCASFTEVFGLETVRLRYFNVYGPRQLPDSAYAAVIPRFCRAMTAGERPVVHGDGTQSRDFTFVSDVVQANLKAAEAPGVAGKLYNVACGRRTTLLEMVGHLNDLLGTDLEPQFAAARPGDVKHSQADVKAARADLGYRPAVAVPEGLARYVEWFRAVVTTVSTGTAVRVAA